MLFQRSGIGVALLAVALVMASCGSDTTEGSADDVAGDMAGETTDSTSSGMGAMDGDDHGAMNMGDASATRADMIDGADLAIGDFVLLDTRPQGFDDTTGTAWIARHSGGTTVTVELSGLLPDTEYVSHVHADTCAENGGDHYQFEIGGPEVPPNEIHLAFTSDADGNGFMTAENDRVAGPDAVAFVVHPRDLIDNKIVCADFVSVT